MKPYNLEGVLYIDSVLVKTLIFSCLSYTLDNMNITYFGTSLNEH